MRSSGSLSWFAIGRVVLVLVLLLAFILVPFALWGDRVDAAVPHLLESIVSPWAFAAAGIALLVLDVLLPVPSSVVSVALCVVLGPVAGGSSVMVGMLGAFLLGDAVGRLVPRDRLRAWVGIALWDSCIDRTELGGVPWIAATRPVPVLAEVTAILSGVLGIPLRRSLPLVTVSCSAVSAAYAACAWLGLQQSSAGAVVLGATLPSVSWLAYRALVSRQARS